MTNTPESTPEKEVAIVEVSPETKALVEKEMSDESDDVKERAMELIEAIKKKAMTETKEAGDFTVKAYLSAVQNAKEALEKSGEFATERKAALDKSIDVIEKEASENWEKLTEELDELGDRLAGVADAAWKLLTKPLFAANQDDDDAKS
ncbi:hypothetical protein Pse7367_0645 [Thalassoporum mexicanum PCC 7367]|uniref:hypothetical protein n=1 Tax=Thalassoporum mexicanum TaxID=3457544 RepID=UPI00029FD1EF|nr:hypothetical protein [Pseudanabaena sp. PCC 7367]AFY68948.1 hypothetical protein Pse7367_0645 [Pseudanabaena sp. PCC 7367]